MDKFVNGKTLERFRSHIYGNLYHVTKFSLYLSFTVHYDYSKITSFTPFYPKELFWAAFICLLSILKISKLESDVWIWRLQSASLGLWTDDCNQLGLQPNKFTPTINLLITKHTCNLVGCGACHSMTAGYPLFLSSKSLQCSKRHFMRIQNSTSYFQEQT